MADEDLDAFLSEINAIEADPAAAAGPPPPPPEELPPPVVIAKPQVIVKKPVHEVRKEVYMPPDDTVCFLMKCMNIIVLLLSFIFIQYIYIYVLSVICCDESQFSNPIMLRRRLCPCLNLTKALL